MTKNLEKYYMNRPVADLLALKSIPTEPLIDGLFVNVLSMTPYGGKFTWLSSSALTPDDINVILPTDLVGNGRWLRDTFIGLTFDASGKLILPSGTAYSIANANPAEQIEINSDISELNSLNIRDEFYYHGSPLVPPTDVVQDDGVNIVPVLSRGFKANSSKSLSVAPLGSFTASFREHLDADYSVGGNISAIPSGGVAIKNGWLDLAHDDNRYVYYQPAGFVPLQNIGTVRFKISFNYSGSPANYRPIFSVSKEMGSTNNLLDITHRPTGAIGLHVLDSSGGTVFDTSVFGVFTPTAGTVYEFALVMDLTNGATRLFIDGVQSGATVTTISAARSSDIGVIAVGTISSYTLYNPNFLIRDLIIYPTALFTSPYTPGYVLPENPISIGNASSSLQNLFVGGNLARTKSLDITAYAGGGQTNATQVYGDFNVISTCNANGDSIKLMPMDGNLSHEKLVKNNGIASCSIYPILNGYIDGVQNAAYLLSPGAAKGFLQTSANRWETFSVELPVVDNGVNVVPVLSRGYSVGSEKNLSVDPAGSFYASFRQAVVADYSISGNLDFTDFGSPLVVNGYLDLAHNDNRYTYMEPTGFVPLQNIGTVKLKIKFNYSGTPADYKPIFSIGKQLNNSHNALTLSHKQTGGYLSLDVRNATGIPIIDDVNIAVFSPVSGTEYEFELSFDLVTGNTIFRINGTQVGSTITTTSTARTADIGSIVIGTAVWFSNFNSNFYIKDFVINPAIIHTANYTPGYSLPESPISIMNSTSSLNNLLAGGNLARSNRIGIIAHAGGGQANATPVYTDFNIVETCATAADSIMLMPMYGNSNHEKTIKNKGVAACNTYPVVGGYIDGVQNAAYSIASGATKRFLQIHPNSWESL